MNEPTDQRINKVLKKFQHHFREDLYNELFIYLFDNPDATDKDLKLFCDRFIYSLRADHLSLSNQVKDEDDEATTFAEILPERINRELQTDSAIEYKRLLNTLPSNHKLIFQLYNEKGIPVKDIAEEYSDLTEITSENHIYRILNTFTNAENTLPAIKSA